MLSAENDPLGPLPPGWGEKYKYIKLYSYIIICIVYIVYIAHFYFRKKS